MPGETGGPPVDQGLVVLTQLLQFLGIPADPKQIQHQVGGVQVGTTEMLRYARQAGLKARCYQTTFDRLTNTPLPGIAALRDGGYLLLGKAGEGKVLVQSPASTRPQLMTQAELEAIWDRRIVLVTRRASLVDLARRSAPTISRRYPSSGPRPLTTSEATRHSRRRSRSPCDSRH